MNTSRATVSNGASAPSGLSVQFEPVAQPDVLGERWEDLERRSAYSFFQSWGWIGCWLKHLPHGLEPHALIVSAGTEVVGLGILVARRELRHGLVRSNGLYLNETGNPLIDPLGLEYNGFLADRRFAGSVVGCCLEWLTRCAHGWEELHLGGLERANAVACAEIAKDIGLKSLVRDKRRYDYVDLEHVRRTGADYLSLLGRGTRAQIRRALRLYEDEGRPCVCAAQDVEQALDALAELKALHQAYWRGRGHPGAFASDFFERFHRDLIHRLFDAGEIQLLRIAAGQKLIGLLYNFIKEGRVYTYQSGFDYDSDPKSKPGMVSHYLAAEYNLAQGAKIYDFMAGDARHKRSLGTDAEEMTWLVLQRPAAKFRMENTLRSIKNRLCNHGKSDIDV